MDSFGQKAVYYAHAGAGELHLRPVLNLKKSDEVALFVKITHAVADLVKNEPQPLSAKEIFDYSVEHYGKTLQRLAE